MGIVWDHFPATAREVCERMTGPRARAYTTIMSTMDRLHKKGVLRRHKSGLAWVYSPTLSEAEFQRALADQLADRIVDEHGEVGLMAVVEAASTDQALLARLEALVAAHKHRTRR